jgi:hypothetical protein
MIVAHNSGFFSCYTVILYEILKYFNNHENSLPDSLDTSRTFGLYKYDENIDVTNIFFERDDTINIDIGKKPVTNSACMDGFQKYNYKNLHYTELIPFIQKYFTPSEKIINIRDKLILKYNINFDNCIALYYRGTDKYTETAIDSFDSYYNKLNDVISNDKELQIIIQTDSAQFLDFMKTKQPHLNIIIINENDVSYTNNGIHNEKSHSENFADIHYFLSTILILAKCKHVICSSSNISVVMMFYRYIYRNNVENIHQNYNLKWL